jgi:DUF218 domain
MKKAVTACCIAGIGALWFWNAARCLVADSAAPSDVIVVLSDEDDETRIQKGISLWEQGYGKEILLDENAELRIYGFRKIELAQEFVAHLKGSAAGKMHVCPVQGDSTFAETAFVGKCVLQYNAHTILLVTSDYHTRLALYTFERMLPQYQWSVAASEKSTEFGKNWWEHRQWAKHTAVEWSKLIWWEAVDRWRMPST